MFDLRAVFYGDRPRRTPPSGALNARVVADESDVTLGSLISWCVEFLVATVKICEYDENSVPKLSCMFAELLALVRVAELTGP